jgi:hypothetical protein
VKYFCKAFNLIVFEITECVCKYKKASKWLGNNWYFENILWQSKHNFHFYRILQVTK